MHRLIENSDVQ